MKPFDIAYEVKENSPYVYIIFVRFYKCKKKFFFNSTLDKFAKS